MKSAPEDDSLRNIVSRFLRIEGQVRGIQRMIDEERMPADVITQVSAILSATKRAAGAFTVHELNRLNSIAAQGDETAAAAAKALIDAFARLD